VLASIGDWIDPEYLIQTFGLIGIFAIIFAESGLMVGFFLPGDSLLFTAGFLASGPEDFPSEIHLPLGVLMIGCFVAAVIGDQVGYWFGKKVGPALFRRPDSRVFKQERVERAHEFFERYGAKTIVLARFVPIVRTFAPIVAGIGKMNYRVFVTYNLIGAALWAIGVTLLGYYLGQIDVVAENLEIAILVIVAISVTPMVIEIWRGRKERKAARLGPPARPEPDLPAGLRSAQDSD
jgi:membrane-associated protein